MIQTSRTIIIQEVKGQTALAVLMTQLGDTTFKVRIKDHENCLGDRCSCLKQVFTMDNKNVVIVPDSAEQVFRVLAVESDKIVPEWDDQYDEKAPCIVCGAYGGHDEGCTVADGK